MNTRNDWSESFAAGPRHPGEPVRLRIEEAGLSVGEAAAGLGCARETLSRLLNGKTGISANMALALEELGWGDAGRWMKMQADYELAGARRNRAAERWARARFA